VVRDRFCSDSSGTTGCVDRSRQPEGACRTPQSLACLSRSLDTKFWPALTDLATRLSHGFVEGKSNRTKASMRQAYGYRNRRHLRLRILVEVPA
jgi:hypothetical protein